MAGDQHSSTLTPWVGAHQSPESGRFSSPGPFRLVGPAISGTSTTTRFSPPEASPRALLSLRGDETKVRNIIGAPMGSTHGGRAQGLVILACGPRRGVRPVLAPMSFCAAELGQAEFFLNLNVASGTRP